ncbi:MAG: hypothetical protein ISR72_12615 [Methylobacter sp.]|nr:hypothetical protein [Methylobacter sp.]
MSNRQLEEKQEEIADRHLASELGMTYEELCELEWDIDTNESNDGLVYEYIVTFTDSSPRNILDKIEGLEDGRVVRLSPSVFVDEDE